MERLELINHNNDKEELIDEFADLLMKESDGALIEDSGEYKKLVSFRKKFSHYEKDAKDEILKRYESPKN